MDVDDVGRDAGDAGPGRRRGRVGHGFGSSFSLKDDIETSQHLKFCGKAADEQELRGHELDLLGLWERARRVRRCGTGAYPHPCNQRGWCPQCSKRIAVDNANRAAAGMRRMANRLVGLFIMPIRWDPEERSKGEQLTSFKTDIAMFKNALKEIRRRKCFRPVVGGVEFVEVELSEHGRSWNLHCHVVLDVAVLDPVEVEEGFKQLTTGRGWFSLAKDDEEKVVAPENISRSAMYFAKSDSWSPQPGALSLLQLDVLQQAIKGVQLVTSWGTAAPPKTRNETSQTASSRKKCPKRVPFHFSPDEWEVVEAAIGRAAERSHSVSRSTNLALVCLDYVANNDFTCNDEGERLRLLAAFERLIEFKLIAWDPDADELVYGYATVKALARGNPTESSPAGGIPMRSRAI